MKLQLRTCVVLFAAVVFAGIALPAFAGALPATRVDAPELAATSKTLLPVADAYVTSQYPDSNFGTRTQLRVDGSPIQRSYLRFSVSGLTQAVTNAVLYVYANTSVSAGYSVYRVSSSSWGETTITYRNSPLLGMVLGSTGAVTAGAWNAVNVCSIVKGNGTYTLALAGTSTTGVSLGSRESTTPPKLVLTLGSVLPPATPTRVGPTPTKAPPTPTSAPNTAPTPVGQTGNWKMIFNDEFTGTALNLAKWRPNWLGSSDTAITGPVNSSESACFDPRQVTVANGELDLTAVARSCNGYRYASGMIQTNGKFNFSYGYMEARIWTPAGTGMWPAFWTDGQNWPTDGEIDILEAYGTDNSEYHYHYAGCGGDCGPGGSVLVSGATKGWHTYAADWEPGSIKWYYDGRQVWQYTSGVVSSPQFVILNLALNSNSAAVPATMKVDYVRVWRRVP